MRGTTLLFLKTSRLPAQGHRRIGAIIQETADAFVVDEIVTEAGSRLRLPVARFRTSLSVSLEQARRTLAPASPGRGHRPLFQELARRCPALQRRIRTSRDRLAQLLAVALALTRSLDAEERPFHSTTKQPHVSEHIPPQATNQA